MSAAAQLYRDCAWADRDRSPALAPQTNPLNSRSSPTSWSCACRATRLALTTVRATSMPGERDSARRRDTPHSASATLAV
eukprot:5066942-Prymnesium_polylepis.1